MATLLDDRSTVGLWPLPGTAKRADLLAGLVTPGVGSFELRPLAFENMAEAVANGDISSVDDYVAPYQTFTLTVTAIPTVPNEVITNVSFDPIPPVPAFTPFKAILEEPNPATKASRSGAEEPQEIAPSPNWDPPLVNEPYIQTIGGVNTATIGGYYTEKSFYDREWVLKFPDVIAKISGAGVRYLRYEDIPQGVPFDPTLFDSAPLAPSSITPATWFAATKADAEILDAPQMAKYIEQSSGVVSYKGSEIRKLRFFYIITITSVVPPATIPITTTIPAFMTVQNNSSWTEKRLTYALNTPKAPSPLVLGLV